MVLASSRARDDEGRESGGGRTRLHVFGLGTGLLMRAHKRPGQTGILGGFAPWIHPTPL